MTITSNGVSDDATRLSTQPVAVGAAGPSRQLLAPVRRTWRQLTSMRTALLLLFLLALASVPGSFLPQRNINPIKVQEYLAAHATTGPTLDRLGMFDAFAAPWFAAIYLLLFISLIGCLGPRIRLHAKALRTPPPPVPRVLTRMPASEQWETTANADAVLAQARTVLKGWRVVQRDGSLSAERGYLRETGNLLFHVSLVGLLIGIALGALMGFKGTVLVKEGDGFANAILNYDDITPGRLFSDDRLVPFSFALKDFRATYADDGAALTFNADLTYKPGVDAPSRPYDLRVNHPLVVGGAKTYLLGHGYAPKVLVRDREGNELEQTVVCLPQGPTFVSTCAIKVYDAAGEQLAFEGIFTPTTLQDPATNRVTSVFPAPNAPALTVLGFRGDLGVDDGRPQSVYQIDKSRLVPIDNGTPHKLVPGATWTMPGGGSITFLETTEWATFQITQDPGKIVALIASIGMVLGLCLSLFVRRRRVWVRVTPSAGGADGAGRTVVEVAGLARTGAEAFTTEFAGLTGRLREQAPATSPPLTQETT